MHRTSGITVIALLVLLVTALMPSVFGVATAAEEQQFIFAPTDPLTPETPTWYLAEGSTAWGFSTYVNIESPNDTEVTARVTYVNPAANTPSGEADHGRALDVPEQPVRGDGYYRGIQGNTKPWTGRHGSATLDEA